MMNAEIIDQIIQTMRTLTLAQIRKQLEWDYNHDSPQFLAVQLFFENAKIQSK
jgi:hypothetical protein